MDERIMTGFDDIECEHTVHDGHIYINVGYMVLGRETPPLGCQDTYMLSAIIIGCVINE